MDPEVKPSVRAYVNIPEAFRERAIERLRKMELQGIVEKVRTAPKWVSGLSAVPKGNDDFRLVVNMVGPNRAIRRRFYKMPELNTIKAKLAGARIFTKLDLTSAFHHVKISEQAKDMTTFLGPDGMYRFCRLNFGVTSAPEAFQQKMEEVLEGIKGVIVYIDDILVFSESAEELRSTTKKVLAALRLNNLTLNEEKCEYEVDRLDFLGHELSKEGFNIAKGKIKDIEACRSPSSIKELKSFLGLASFLSAYIGNFADISEPLWRATSKDQFEWSSELENAFQELKRAIASCTVSQGFFDADDDTFLYTDASPVAVGAVLTQRNKDGEYRVIAFASRLLTPAERRYAQTQREGLGVVWGAEHFWFYLVGKRFTIRTDAEGVAFIMKRGHAPTKRIMKRSDAWALRMEAFDFEVEHVKGADNIADAPSRLIDGIGSVDFDSGHYKGELMSLTVDGPGDIAFAEGTVTLEEIKWHFERDGVLKAVAAALESDEWPRVLGKYKAVKHELRLIGDLVTRMGAVVVPEELRPKVLATAHRGHPGKESMKSILRKSAWWPGMLAHVDRWVANCKSCVLSSRKDGPPPLQRSKLPVAVWESIMQSMAACTFWS